MGAFEEAKGKVKEKVGEWTDNPELVREGEAQDDKGEAEREATQARAKAKAHEAEAEVHEARQEAAEQPSSHQHVPHVLAAVVDRRGRWLPPVRRLQRAVPATEPTRSAKSMS